MNQILVLTEEEIHYLRRFLEISGVREKSEILKGYRNYRTDEMKVLGRALKKLRKADLTG